MNRAIKILGIESSCDETSAAVVENGRRVLSNVVYSQTPLHSRFRGIVPEIASRSHVERINGIIAQALEGRHSPDAIAVTTGPGLVGSLIVGKMSAQALGWVWGKPVIPVHHLEAHLFANVLSNPELEPPFLGLIASGGHTDLILVHDYGNYKMIGRTRDDAAGECFDKVANVLGLGHPGGPEIDRLAAQGNPRAVSFPHPHMKGSWDFSFSGLKTALLYYSQKEDKKASLPDICASFQDAVVDVLVTKTLSAAKKFGLNQVSIGGGVAANSSLRKRFLEDSKKAGITVHLPPKNLCTDNAAMIAALGFYKFTRSPKKDPSLRVDPSMPVSNWE